MHPIDPRHRTVNPQPEQPGKRLSIQARQIRLGITARRGRAPIPDISLYAWLFGDESPVLYGDGSQVTYL